MANQSNSQHPASAPQSQTRNPPQAQRQPASAHEMRMRPSHGQGQVRNPDTDRRLKGNREAR